MFLPRQGVVTAAIWIPAQGGNEMYGSGSQGFSQFAASRPTPIALGSAAVLVDFLQHMTRHPESGGAS